MNSFKGDIVNVETSGGLSLVSVKVHEDITLKSIVIETPETAPHLKIGNELNVLFKETEVVIGTQENHSISLQNRIAGTVSSIEKGTLISKVVLSSAIGDVTAIISSNAVHTLQLKEQSQIVAMVKLNEIMLSK